MDLHGVCLGRVRRALGLYTNRCDHPVCRVLGSRGLRALRFGGLHMELLVCDSGHSFHVAALRLHVFVQNTAPVLGAPTRLKFLELKRPEFQKHRRRKRAHCIYKDLIGAHLFFLFFLKKLWREKKSERGCRVFFCFGARRGLSGSQK